MLISAIQQHVVNPASLLRNNTSGLSQLCEICQLGARQESKTCQERNKNKKKTLPEPWLSHTLHVAFNSLPKGQQ